MTAGKWMAREFQTLHPDTAVEEVIRRLKSPDSDPLLVCDGNRLIGTVAYRDVAAGAVAGGHRGGLVRARDLVGPDLVYCLETTKREEAEALMRDNDLRLLPVLNADGRLVGVLTLASLPRGDAPVHAESPSSSEAGST